MPPTIAMIPHYYVGSDAFTTSGSMYPEQAISGTRAVAHPLPVQGGEGYIVGLLDAGAFDPFLDFSEVKGKGDDNPSVLLIDGISVSGRKFTQINSIYKFPSYWNPISNDFGSWNRSGALLISTTHNIDAFPVLVRLDDYPLHNGFITVITGKHPDGIPGHYALADAVGTSPILKTVEIVILPHVVVEDNMSLNPALLTERPWAIGGYRRDMTTIETRRIFSEAKPGWTIRLMNMEYHEGGVVMTASGKYDGNGTDGSIIIQGAANQHAPYATTIYTNEDVTPFELANSSGNLVFSYIIFRHTPLVVLNNIRHAFNIHSFKGGLLFDNCSFLNTSTNSLSHGFNCEDINPGLSGMMLQFRRCYFEDCSGFGVNIGSPSSKINYTVQFICCDFINNKMGNVRLYNIRNALFLNNTFRGGGKGIVLAGTDCSGATIMHNTIDGNGESTDGIDITAQSSQNGLMIRNNIFCRHTRYGINCESNQEDGCSIIDHNAFPTDSVFRNAQGPYSPYFSADGRERVGLHDITDSPEFSINNPGFNYYTIGTNTYYGKAFPEAEVNIGLNSMTKTILQMGTMQSRKNQPVLRTNLKVR